MAATCMDRLRELEKRGVHTEGKPSDVRLASIRFTRRQMSKCRRGIGTLFARLFELAKSRDRMDRELSREVLGVVGIKKEDTNAKRPNKYKRGKAEHRKSSK